MESKENTKAFTVKATFLAHFSDNQYGEPVKFKSRITVHANSAEDIDAEKIMEEFMGVLHFTINVSKPNAVIIFTSVVSDGYAGAINLSRVNFFDLEDWYVMGEKEA